MTSGHFFEPTYDNPGFTADRSYRGLISITANGLTFESGCVTSRCSVGLSMHITQQDDHPLLFYHRPYQGTAMGAARRVCCGR